MFRFILVVFISSLLLSCGSSKNISAEDEQLSYSYITDSVAYKFEVRKNGKISYVGKTGVPVKGRVNFMLPEGSKFGLWAQIDDHREKILQASKGTQSLEDHNVRINFQFVEGQGELTFKKGESDLTLLETIFEAMLHYPMRQ